MGMSSDGESGRPTDWLLDHERMLDQYCRLLIRPGRDPADLDPQELFQEVVLRAMQAAGKGVIQQPENWLKGVARNVHKEMLRCAIRRRQIVCLPEATALEFGAAGTSVMTGVLRGEDRRLVTQFLASLSRAECDLLRWRIYDGLSLEECARRLGIRTEAAGKRLQRLLARARAVGMLADRA